MPCENAGISTASVTKMGMGGYVSTEILDKICGALDCEVEDIMDFMPQEDGNDRSVAILPFAAIDEWVERKSKHGNH